MRSWPLLVYILHNVEASLPMANRDEETLRELLLTVNAIPMGQKMTG